METEETGNALASRWRARRRKLHQDQAANRVRYSMIRSRVHCNIHFQAKEATVANKLEPCDRKYNPSKGQVSIKLVDVNLKRKQRSIKVRNHSQGIRTFWLKCLASVTLSFLILSLVNDDCQHSKLKSQLRPHGIILASSSLIIGDSAIEIQELDDQQNQQQQPHNNAQVQEQQQQMSSLTDKHHSPNIILGSANDADSSQNPAFQAQANADGSLLQISGQRADASQKLMSSSGNNLNRLPSGPLPPLSKAQAGEDITDGDKNSRPNHDFVLDESAAPKDSLADVISAQSKDDPHETDSGKMITGKVVDFELQPAGNHNKAKIEKKKKKKKKMESEFKAFKKWNKKKKSEKKAIEKEEKKHMKKKKEEGKKTKKKWGLDVKGQKKKGSFKKKKWGKKVKKGKGVKKGKKGKKFLKDKGHKNTGFKTVYHKEEWGKSSKWHDIKREKKWDEKSKKWKKKWKKEKGKKYKGDHMKKFEKKKKEGKKYKKAKEEKFKKYKKEKFEKGKKKKMEENKKKKEGGMKKEEQEMMKKKKKKKP